MLENILPFLNERIVETDNQICQGREIVLLICEETLPDDYKTELDQDDHEFFTTESEDMKSNKCSYGRTNDSALLISLNDLCELRATLIKELPTRTQKKKYPLPTLKHNELSAVFNSTMTKKVAPRYRNKDYLFIFKNGYLTIVMESCIGNDTKIFTLNEVQAFVIRHIHQVVQLVGDGTPVKFDKD